MIRIRLLVVALIVASLATLATAQVAVDLGHVIPNARELEAKGHIEEAYSLLEEAMARTSDELAQRRLISCMVELSLSGQDRIVSFINHASNADAYVTGDNKAYLRFHLAKRYAQLGDYTSSHRVLQESLDIAPKSEWTWYMKYQVGFNFYAQGKYREAQHTFDGLKATPGATDSQKIILEIQLLSTLFSSHQWQELIQEAEPVMAHLPDDVRKLAVLDQLGGSYRAVGDELSAARVWRQFLDLHAALYPRPGRFQERKRAFVQMRYDAVVQKWPEIFGSRQAMFDKTVEEQLGDASTLTQRAIGTSVDTHNRQDKAEPSSKRAMEQQAADALPDRARSHRGIYAVAGIVGFVILAALCYSALVRRRRHN
jgi:tetratricopeptide (TPR) repeat protein